MCPTRPQRTPVLSHVSNQTSEDRCTKSCVQPDLRALLYLLSHMSNQTSEDSRTKSCVQPDLSGLPY
ncbi:hypothetical protein Pmani_024722 [Petrolisthes manimaculis]|uniref:Uncharacterized protein n=1 Tax=Petrolisthes manimaculis TaxID=1843537 RepID=A0AAE1P6T3_9EUCA|nr:hypothetical protein Pmani_024722 [Petrolisthes manimaculis]